MGARSQEVSQNAQEDLLLPTVHDKEETQEQEEEGWRDRPQLRGVPILSIEHKGRGWVELILRTAHDDER